LVYNAMEGRKDGWEACLVGFGRYL